MHVFTCHAASHALGACSCAADAEVDADDAQKEEADGKASEDAQDEEGEAAEADEPTHSSGSAAPSVAPSAAPSAGSGTSGGSGIVGGGQKKKLSLSTKRQKP